MEDYNLEETNKILDKSLAFSKEMFQLAQGYNQVMIAAGYAAFLTLWAKLSPNLPRTVVLLSGALLGSSLLLFVAFHLLQMVIRALPAITLGRALQAAAGDIEKQLIAFGVYDAANARGQGLVMVLWVPVFGISVVTGFSAAMLVIGYAFWSVVYLATP